MDEKIKENSLFERFGVLVSKINDNNLRSDFVSITYELNDLLLEKEKEIKELKKEKSGMVTLSKEDMKKLGWPMGSRVLENNFPFRWRKMDE